VISALPYLVVFALIFLVFVLPAFRSFRKEEAEARRMLEEARASGRTEPTSIRPWVDPERCIGSGLCVAVCPEGDVLQVVDGVATLVNAASCVGHGACAAACPVGAIQLKFGSDRRGVDIPAVGPDFQTNVPGLYVAGELGGMGLIGNAIAQGVQAVDSVRADRGTRPEGGLDLVIIGAGPAGIGASLQAKKHGLEHAVLEQDAFGGAILHFPRKKIIMTHGMQLPGRPKIGATTMTKQELIDLLSAVIDEEQLPVSENERVVRVEPCDDGTFAVHTPDRVLRTARVILSVGRRGTPRKLGCAGEECDKVAYRLVDAEQVHHEHIMVVGGGDSAIEAACSLALSDGNRVTLSYRKGNITRPKKKNRERLDTLVDLGKIELRLDTQVQEIAPDRVVLTHPERTEVVPNDRVYVFAGGVLPTELLVDAGIQIERHFGDRIEVLSEGRS
jgi:thioredoxin reductase (NADPH)